MRTLSIFLSLILSFSAFALPVPKKVLISQFVEHPALNTTLQGIIKGLEEQGYQKGVNLEYRIESAQGNALLASQIANKFINQHPDVVVGVATVSAQSFVKYAKGKSIPLIFSSVTDPLKAGLTSSLQPSSLPISGVSNFIPLEPQLTLFKTIDPKLKRLGFLYNPSEANSLSLVATLKSLCPQFGITLVPQTAHKTADISQAMVKLIPQVDAVFISNDSTALSALSSIIKISNKAKKPVYVSDTDAVALGALAALGPNQYKIGLQTGYMIARVLKGTPVSAIPIEFPKEQSLYLNENAAHLIGIEFSTALKQKASSIIQRTL